MTNTSVNPVLLVATRKGAWLFHGDAARRSWRADGPHWEKKAMQAVACERIKIGRAHV